MLWSFDHIASHCNYHRSIGVNIAFQSVHKRTLNLIYRQRKKKVTHAVPPLTLKIPTVLHQCSLLGLHLCHSVCHGSGQLQQDQLQVDERTGVQVDHDVQNLPNDKNCVKI